jgi:hypothetical protein
MSYLSLAIILLNREVGFLSWPFLCLLLTSAELRIYRVRGADIRQQKSRGLQILIILMRSHSI